MSKWKKYESMAESSGDARKTPPKRMQQQFDTALGIWAFSQPNSIIRVAKVFRCMAQEVGKEMSFDESIHRAQKFAKGRLK